MKIRPITLTTKQITQVYTDYIELSKDVEDLLVRHEVRDDLYPGEMRDRMKWRCEVRRQMSSVGKFIESVSMELF